MQNNNQKAIGRLAKRSFHSNLMRNVFAITAIALTCLLFTSLFTIGLTLNSSLEMERMRQVGTTAHAGLKDLTQEQWDVLKTHSSIRSFCTNQLMGETKDERLIKRPGEIRCVGEGDYLKTSFIELTAGKKPEAEKEILLDTITLDLLGLPYKLGSTIPLTFMFMNQEYSDNFILSGYYQGDPVIGASQIYISREYWNEISKDYTYDDFKEAELKGETEGTGLIQASIWFKNSSKIEETVKKVITDSGFEVGGGTENSIDYGVNWAYTVASLEDIDGQTVGIMGVALLVILLTGYLIIYNIFQISVVNDIRFYGLLKTIGTTKRQIRRLIQWQVLMLSAAGIPIGLLLGYIVGQGLIPFILESLDGLRVEQIAFNPLIFVFGAIFSLITVLISSFKPARIAGNVSAIEAVQYVENTVSYRKNKKEKVSKYGGKIWRMAWSNLGRSKKKTTVVIASISLSVILLVEIVTLVQGFRIDKYLEEMLNGDFMVASVDYFRYRGGELSKELKEQCLLQPGVENYEELYEKDLSYGHIVDDNIVSVYQEAYNSGKMKVDPKFQEEFNAILNKEIGMTEIRYGFDEYALNKLEIKEGHFDLAKFMTGKYVLISEGIEEISLYKPGDEISLGVYSKKSKYVFNEDTFDYEKGIPKGNVWENVAQKEYEVMAIVNIPYGLGVRHFANFGLFSVLPKDEFLNVTKIEEEGKEANLNYAMLVNVEDDKEADYKKFLDNYTTNIDAYAQFESKEGLSGEFEGMVSMITVIGGGLAAVVAIIGILNFINSMFTGVITRKREFALLQGIGMTGSQLMKMLLFESLYYIMAATIISITIGSILSKLVIGSFNSILSYFEYSFTWVPFICTIPVFLLIAVLVPVIAYYSVRKQSIVERLM